MWSGLVSEFGLAIIAHSPRCDPHISPSLCIRSRFILLRLLLFIVKLLSKNNRIPNGPPGAPTPVGGTSVSESFS